MMEPKACSGVLLGLKELNMKIIDIPWHLPITVTLQSGTERRFMGAYDALDFLENEWPIRKGRHYESAKSLCRAALNRTISTEVAREAFIASCLEAGLKWHSGHEHIPASRGRQFQIGAA
jgi:hypothetical protein